MRIPLYQVDAFTDRLFAGNPAAVCPLEHWIPAETMQSIAAENNLAETAFYVPDDSGSGGGGGSGGNGSKGGNGRNGRNGGNSTYAIRWFTPVAEIDLAGHPTLATAHVLFEELGVGGDVLRFTTAIGDRLVVRRDEAGRLSLDFPARPPAPGPDASAVATALGAEPVEVLGARDGFAVFADEAAVRALRPDFTKFDGFDFFGLIATAPGDDCDFVSRFFAPRAGIPEDPVTGSAHCTLIPYWAARLGKTEMHARQISPRGGELFCRDNGKRVAIAGNAVTYMVGSIEL